jgi:hypothetical protein
MSEEEEFKRNKKRTRQKEPQIVGFEDSPQRKSMLTRQSESQ